MPSTYTPNLGIEKPATGEQAGVWGTTANNSYDFIDMAVDGNVTIPLSASAYTLLTNQGTASTARSKVLLFTGSLSADGTITIAPNTAKKIYFVVNQTTGGFALNFVQGTGPSFKLLNGRSAMIYSDGQGAAAHVGGVLTDLQVNSLLVQASLIINLGSDAPYDLYYRSAAGTMARLGNGAAGQVLTATAAGPSWAPATGIGLPVAGAAAGQVFFASASAQLAQDPNFQWNGAGLGIGMAPTAALCVGGALPATIQLDAIGPTPAGRSLVFSTGNSARWTLQTSFESESGGAGGVGGSNFMLESYNNSGAVPFYNFVSYRTGRSVFGIYGDNYNAQLAIVNAAAAQAALLVQGAVGQTGFLQIWRDSNGNMLASMNGAGALNVGRLGVGVAVPGWAIDAAGDINCSGVFRIQGAPLVIPVIPPMPPSPFTTQTVLTGRSLGTVYTNGTKVIFTSIALSMPPNTTVQVMCNLGTPNTLVTSVANPSAVSIAAAVGFWTMPGHSFQVQNLGSPVINNWIEYS